ncbi:MAG TPA: hypothetical protein VK627_08880 [Edaphobacter sp.]|jgi:hypothetical protein|nr:hypothetical protein [Edaphobacter sp.]
MQTDTLPTLQASHTSPYTPPAAGGFFATHQVGAVIRSLFLSSLLWVFLAFSLYTVYSFVVAAN